MDGGFRRLISVVALIAAGFTCSPVLEAARSALHLDWASTLKRGRGYSNVYLNFATPVAVEGRVFVGNSGGYLYAIELKKGRKVWEKRLEGPVESRPLYENGVIFLGDGKGFAYSIRAEDGEINWKSYVGEEIMTTPASGTDAVYFATQNNSVAALDKSSGAMKWIETRPQPFASMSIKACSDPVLIDDKIFVGNTDGVLVAYGAAGGEKIFTLPLASGRGEFADIDTSPLKYNGSLSVSTMEGALYSIDFRTGKDRWSQPIGTPNNIVFNGGLFYVTAGGKVYCINADSGDVVWERDLKAPELSEAALWTSYVIVVSTNEKVYVLDRATGDVVLQRYLGSGAFGTPVVVGDRLLVLTNSNEVYAFRID